MSHAHNNTSNEFLFSANMKKQNVNEESSKTPVLMNANSVNNTASLELKKERVSTLNWKDLRYEFENWSAVE